MDDYDEMGMIAGEPVDVLGALALVCIKQKMLQMLPLDSADPEVDQWIAFARDNVRSELRLMAESLEVMERYRQEGRYALIMKMAQLWMGRWYQMAEAMCLLSLIGKDVAGVYDMTAEVNAPEFTAELVRLKLIKEVD